MILKNITPNRDFIVTIAISNNVTVACRYMKGRLTRKKGKVVECVCELQKVCLKIDQLIVGTWDCPSVLWMNEEMRVSP